MKQIEGFENYLISQHGDVYSLPKKTRKGTRKLKPVKQKTGYLLVDLVKNGCRTKKLVHRLVAEAYIPNLDNKPQVNHIDGVKHNNHKSNLEWATRSENQKHAIRIGLRTAKGEKNSQAKLDMYDVLEIRELLKTTSKKELSKMYKVSISTIYDIQSKRSWSHI